MSRLDRRHSFCTSSTSSRQGHPPRNRHCGWSFAFLAPLMGLAALVWFLFRVISKPSRATYPCQRAAFPLAASFIIWISGALGVRMLFGHAISWCLAPRNWWLSMVAAMVLWVVLGGNPFGASAWIPDPHGPIGTAKGIFPGRVVWVRDPAATRWNGVNGNWWDDYTGVGSNTNGTDQVVVDAM